MHVSVNSESRSVCLCAKYAFSEGRWSSCASPRAVESCLLGYAGGRGNYKVQDVASRNVFVSRDVVFEEGEPHRTSLSVGENIPLSDTILETLNNGEVAGEVTGQHPNQPNDQRDIKGS